MSDRKPLLCRHCRREVINRPRGLGWTCYYTPEIRALYPAMTPQEAGAIGGRKYRPSQHRRGTMSSLFDDLPPAAPPIEARAALADPATSHQAADRMNRSGKAQRNGEAVRALVAAHPGLTSRELSALPDCPAGVDRVEAARRLSDLERAGAVRKGDARECSLGQGRAMTWYATEGV